MSSPKSALGGGFNPHGSNPGLGYTKPRSGTGTPVLPGTPVTLPPHLIRQRSRSPGRVSVSGLEPLTANDPGSFARHRLRRGLSCTDVHLLEWVSRARKTALADV